MLISYHVTDPCNEQASFCTVRVKRFGAQTRVALLRLQLFDVSQQTPSFSGPALQIWAQRDNAWRCAAKHEIHEIPPELPHTHRLVVRREHPWQLWKFLLWFSSLQLESMVESNENDKTENSPHHQKTPAKTETSTKKASENWKISKVACTKFRGVSPTLFRLLRSYLRR